jgi:elongation factor P
LITGRTIEIAFHASETANEAEISKKEIKFLYKTPKGEYWFCEASDPSKRFTLSSDLLGNKVNYLVANTIVVAKLFGEDEDEKIIGLTLPVKMEFKIVDCPPNVRGDTATGGSKIATLETGAKVNVPLFISNGETIRINTENGEYVERVR